MRKIGAALALASLLFFQPTLAQAQRAAEPVRIAHAQNFPPLAEVRGRKSEGLAIDILRAAAARVGVEVQFLAVPFEQLPLTVADGRAEGIFPLAGTPERRQLFDFTEGLLVTGITLYVRAGRCSGVEQSCGRTHGRSALSGPGGSLT